MRLKIELSEADVKQLVIDELKRRLGETPLDPKEVKIETKSKQNYKSEWEVAAYRVTYDADI